MELVGNVARQQSKSVSRAGSMSGYDKGLHLQAAVWLCLAFVRAESYAVRPKHYAMLTIPSVTLIISPRHESRGA